MLINEKIYNILFLCTGNSARSIMAEGIMNTLGRGRFKAFSAGSRPVGRVNPLAIETLKKYGHDVEGLHSKSWEEFAAPGAPKMDFIITVCDNAAGEVCPIWPGRPVTAHWGFADPSHIEGDDNARRAAFNETYRQIRRRISLFLELNPNKLERMP